MDVFLQEAVKTGCNDVKMYLQILSNFVVSHILWFIRNHVQFLKEIFDCCFSRT